MKLTATLLELATLTTLILAQNQTNSTREIMFEPSKQFRLQYNIINETSANPTLNATLSITGFDTSRWTTADGRTGMYMGIGFGGTTMSEIDAIMCMYLWNNRTTDSYSCTDLSFESYRQPATTTEIQDVRNVRTGSVNVRNGTFTVNFQRTFRTTENSPIDFPLTLATHDFIWSYGNVAGGAPQQHVSRGTIRFNVQSGQIFESPSFSSVIKASLSLCSLLLALAFY